MIHTNINKCRVGGWMIQDWNRSEKGWSCLIITVQNTNDIAIVAYNERDMSGSMTTWDDELKIAGMKISTDKKLKLYEKLC